MSPVDVVTTLMSTLTTLSRSARRPALGAIFLLNNVSHITTELLFNPSTPIDMLLPPPVRDILQSNFRTAKAGYFDANFSPLVQALSDGGPGSSAAKAATKEKFTRFFDLLDEIAERHRFAKVLPDDSKNRDIVADEAVKLVVPSLQRFIQRNGGKDFSKSSSSLANQVFSCIIADMDPQILRNVTFPFPASRMDAEL